MKKFILTALTVIGAYTGYVSVQKYLTMANDLEEITQAFDRQVEINDQLIEAEMRRAEEDTDAARSLSIMNWGSGS